MPNGGIEHDVVRRRHVLRRGLLELCDVPWWKLLPLSIVGVHPVQRRDLLRGGLVNLHRLPAWKLLPCWSNKIFCVPSGLLLPPRCFSVHGVRLRFVRGGGGVQLLRLPRGVLLLVAHGEHGVCHMRGWNLL